MILQWVYAILITAAIVGLPFLIVGGISDFMWWWKFTRGRNL